MTNQPNLNNIPALDRVEIGAGRGEARARWLIIGFLLLITAVFTVLAWAIGGEGSAGSRFGMVFLLMAALGSLTGAIVTVLKLYHWRIDNDGVYAGGLLGRSRFIPWRSVTDVALSMGSYAAVPTISLTKPLDQSPSNQITVAPNEPIDGRVFIELAQWKDIQESARGYIKGFKVVTANGSFGIPQDYKLWASVLQHTNLVRANYENPLLSHAMSYWAPIPEGVPDQAEWRNTQQNPPRTRRSGIILAVALLLALVIADRLRPQNHWLSDLFMLPWMIFLFSLGTLDRAARLLVKEAHASETGIRVVTSKGELEVAWSDCSGEYDSSNHLILSCSDGASLFACIPLLRYDEGCDQLHYTIIKHLRERGQAIALPESLRIEEEPEAV